MARRFVNKRWFQDTLRQAGMSQATLARKIGLSAPALSNALGGTRRLQVEEIHAIARALNKSPRAIQSELGIDADYDWGAKISVMGYVGAGDSVNIMDEDDPNYGFDEINPPFLWYNGTVLRIRGDSMAPRFIDGDLVAFRPHEDIGRIVGKEVVAKLNDGRLVLKRLQRGTEPGSYTLVSVNPTVPPILNAHLQWASPIDWTIPA